jgi:hypothetical protein
MSGTRGKRLAYLDDPLGPPGLSLKRSTSSDSAVDGGEGSGSDLVLDERLEFGRKVSELI